MPRNAAAKAPRLALLLLAAALLIAGAVGVVVLRTTGLGAGGLGGAADRLEDWIGRQIVGIANSYLVPEIAFDEIDYAAPGTVRLEGVSLTAPDGTRVVAAGGMTVLLAEVPRIGEPLVIERLTLDRPTVALIRESREDGSAGFKGLRPMVRRSPVADDAVEPGLRLSQVLRLRAIDINDGSFRYDPADGTPAMVIEGFTTTVNAAPDESEAGWYTLEVASALGPLLELTLNGVVSLDTFDARIDALRFSGRLEEETRRSLPPPLQSLVAEHEARGEVDLTASGSLPLTNPVGGSLRGTLSLRQFRVASGEYAIPIDAVDAEFVLDAGFATLSSLRAELLRGSFTAHGDVELESTGRPARASWEAAGIELRDLLRAGGESGQTPKLAGKLNGSGSVAASLDSGASSLAGTGEVRVREGRLLVLPGLTQLANAMDIATGRLAGGALSHKADATFEIVPEGVRVTRSEITTEALGARATGLIGFDGSLDLLVNAGPMEKIQSLLGGIGDAIGSITDRLLKYRLGGTVEEPTVSVLPLGIGG